jgi:predicted porin
VYDSLKAEFVVFVEQDEGFTELTHQFIQITSLLLLKLYFARSRCPCLLWWFILMFNSLESLPMKKSILSLALLAATGVYAQSVTLYGVADLAYNNDVKKSTAGAKTETSDVITNGLSTSRLGVKGDREIMSGLKANFVMEFEVDQSSDSGIVKTRIGTVGLAGSMGGVTFGRRNTLIKDIENSFDANDGPTAAGYLGDNARESRRNDMITYTTPVFSGFSADAQLGFGAVNKETNGAGLVTNDGKSGDSTSLALNYVNGPFAVKFGTETVKAFSKSVSVAGASVAVPTAMADRKNDAFGLSYDLGVAKLFYVNTRMKQGTQASLVTFDTSNFGVRVPMGNFTLNAGVSDGTAKLTTSAVKADLSGVQLSVWYALNKDTTLYGVYGKETIKHTTYTTTSEDKTMLVGVRYKF